jgi:argininosuccinate lyase
MRVDPNEIFGQRILAPIFEFNHKHNFLPLIAAHRAWLIALNEAGVVSRDDCRKILHGLAAIENAGPDVVRPFDAALDYYYLHMERALVERVPGGEAAVGNLNLGRTRPEPLERMVVREKLLGLLESVLDMRGTLLAKAEAEADTIMPGYTHLQHAQPTTLGHYLLAIHDHLERDTRRLLAAFHTTDHCTLGCGAMSGTSLPVDRNRVRELLGFEALCENTIDSVSAGDHVTEAASAITSLMSIIGRLCQDLYIWSSQEYGMIDVTDAFSSPSSLMPQKKNALVLEYVRSRTARCIGSLAGSFSVLHNVGYMDTEEVEIECYLPLFDAIEIANEAMPTMDALIAAMEPNRELMQKRAAWGFSSVTALAEAILQAQKSLSYRTAHRIVARAVLLAVEHGRDATGIDMALLDSAAEEMTGRKLGMTDEAISDCLAPRRFVDRHQVVGATAPAEVRRMLQSRQHRLTADTRTVSAMRTRLREGEQRLQAAVAAILTA